jgi:hypothetical protein
MTSNDSTYHRYVRRLDGTLQSVDLAHRNGRIVPRFHPSMVEAPEPEVEDSPDYRELVDEVTQNLNAGERHMWLRLLEGRTIGDFAEEGRISRAAVYDRLRRMVAKNDYVAIWWRLRKKVNQYL